MCYRERKDGNLDEVDNVKHFDGVAYCKSTSILFVFSIEFVENKMVSLFSTALKLISVIQSLNKNNLDFVPSSTHTNQRRLIEFDKSYLLY